MELKCPNCGSTKNPYVDYERSIKGYGTYVVCPDCKHEELT